MTVVPELGGIKMFDEKNRNKIGDICLVIALIGIIGYVFFIDYQVTTLNQKVAVLQEQNLVCVVDANNNVQYDQKTGQPLCDSLRNFATGFYQEHQMALVDHRNAIIDLNRTVVGHEQVLIKFVGDLYQQPQEGVLK